jgi:hypothetical protein
MFTIIIFRTVAGEVLKYLAKMKKLERWKSKEF